MYMGVVVFTKLCLLSQPTGPTVNNSSFTLGHLQGTSKPFIPLIAVIFEGQMKHRKASTFIAYDKFLYIQVMKVSEDSNRNLPSLTQNNDKPTLCLCINRELPPWLALTSEQKL